MTRLSCHAGCRSTLVLTFVPPDEDQRQGYMGHDVFTVTNGALTRSSPRYAEGDSNAEPTGGILNPVYSFADGAWAAAETAGSSSGSISRRNIVPDKKRVEVFTAGCPVCQKVVDLVESLACDSCEVDVLDMRDPAVAQRADDLGVESVPAVLIDGKLAACCEGQGIDEAALMKAILG